MASLRNIGHRLYTGDISYNFVGHKRRWYILSLIMIVVSLLALSIRGLDLGIEFEGGADFQVKVAQVNDSTVDTYRSVIENSGLPNMDDTTVTTIGSSQVRIQTRSLSVDEVAKVRSLIADQAGVSSAQVAYQLIGPSWGSQISKRALIALVVFLVLVTIVIWAAFRDWKMSIAALIALLHDLVITVGVYALVGFSVAPATLIGVLTILGYSLYDTVVVFDKVRENVRGITGSTTRTFSEAANHAVNQVLVRSLNTTVIGVLPVSALLFAGAFILGEGPLKDLALALFVGMIAGAYSSIFIATPLLSQMREREPQMIRVRHRVENRRAKLAGRSMPHQIEDRPATRAKAKAKAERKRPSGRYDNADLARAEAEVATIDDGTAGGRKIDDGTAGGRREDSTAGGRRIGVDVVGSGETPLRTLGISDDSAADSGAASERTSTSNGTATRRRRPAAERPDRAEEQRTTPRDTSATASKRPQPRHTPRSKRKKRS